MAEPVTRDPNLAVLAPRHAWAGLNLPLTLGGVTLAVATDTALASVMPFRGRQAGSGETLGAPLPEPGRSAALPGGGRVIHAGLDAWLLQGDAPAELADHAAVVDQSDGWTAFTLTGGAAEAALARLVPLDLSEAAFPEGAAASTMLGHMACMLVREAPGFAIFVSRSFTVSAVHDLGRAMRHLEARRRLP